MMIDLDCWQGEESYGERRREKAHGVEHWSPLASVGPASDQCLLVPRRPALGITQDHSYYEVEHFKIVVYLLFLKPR